MYVSQPTCHRFGETTRHQSLEDIVLEHSRSDLDTQKSTALVLLFADSLHAILYIHAVQCFVKCSPFVVSAPLKHHELHTYLYMRLMHNIWALVVSMEFSDETNIFLHKALWNIIAVYFGPLLFFLLDLFLFFRVITSCSTNISYKCRGKDGKQLNQPGEDFCTKSSFVLEGQGVMCMVNYCCFYVVEAD